MLTASEITAAGDGQASSDVLLLGAAGNSGRLIAAELAARGLSVRLAGRRRGPLEDLARALAADGATTDVRTVDLRDAASLTEAIVGVGVALSTIGPFARQAGPVIDACLAAILPYVDIANEWLALRGLLDRDEQARAHAVTLVTGAGFGPAATETLVLRLVEQIGMVPGLVRVAAAPGVTQQSHGVRQTIQESLSHGVAITYRHGQVVQEALGTGATILTFGGARRQMLPGPVGDLEAARLASGAANVVAYIANPAARISATNSHTWAEVSGPDGHTLTAELHTGEGVRAAAAIAAEFYTADVFMHTWDLARATGQDDRLDSDFCAELLAGMELLEEVMRSSGQYGARVPVKDDADAQTKMLGFIGRDPDWTPR